MGTDFTNPDNLGRDELKALPEKVKNELAAHLELYKTDPDAAHYWDPIVIGVPGGPVASLVLQHTGRKSGKPLECVLQYFQLDDKLAVVGSRGGTWEHPYWYLNLVANPECVVQVGRERFKARARTVIGAERERWYPFVKREQPMQAEYEKRTSREIPVVVLERIR